jgi:SAM-dependent methyltransferase
MLTDKTVVEFYYNTNASVNGKFRWVPLRTRYDKTEAVIKYRQQYGNYSTMADRIWQSIINPVLMSDFEDLAQGNNPDKNIYFYDKKMDTLRKRISYAQVVSAAKEDKYFQVKSELGKPMRSFHNFIKDTMIHTYVHSMYQDNRQKTVLDLGCGKGQDLNKFYYAKIAFYVGIDYSKEDILSPIDGAVSRYNKFKSKPGFPKMNFIHGDFASELNYESQFKSLGGMDRDNKFLLEKFFSSNSKMTFDILHFGFSIHYAFKNETTFKNLKSNINNYLRDDGYLLITTFDAYSVRKLLKGKDKFTQEYTDENGKVKILFEIVKKYNDAPDDAILDIGNAIDVHMSWISNEGVYLTEYLVDGRYITDEFKRDCNLELVDTDLFANQYTYHEKFITEFSEYEADIRTRSNFAKVASFYKQNSINNGCRIMSFLYRTYVFRKKKDTKNISKKQKGGNDFSNVDKFVVPTMTGYDTEHTLLNSIHHILRNHKIIPKTLPVERFYEDLKIDYIIDEELDGKIKSIAKKLVIYHQNDKGEEEKVVNGLNIFVVERDCNNNYDTDIIKCKKEITDDDLAIILMREGNLYVPVYGLDENKVRKGMFYMDDTFITELIESLEEEE